MPKTADLGVKRLVSLDPKAWVEWLTGRSNVTVLDVLSQEFQWIGRASDVVIRAVDPDCGEFALINEVQLRYQGRVPRRMFGYSGLTTEKLDLPVYPVLVNILPPAEGVVIADRYEASVMGLRGYQEYRVVNLWEVGVEVVFETPLPQLLPFAPVFRGGGDEGAIRQALRTLRADERLSEMEPLLAFFATFVLDSDLVKRIMRWDMAVLMESPWYREILEQGQKQGEKQGERRGQIEMAQKSLLITLDVRLGPIPWELTSRIRAITDPDRLEALLRTSLTVDTLQEFEQALD